jgi:hypothetical protein
MSKDNVANVAGTKGPWSETKPQIVRLRAGMDAVRVRASHTKNLGIFFRDNHLTSSVSHHEKRKQAGLVMIKKITVVRTWRGTKTFSGFNK